MPKLCCHIDWLLGFYLFYIAAVLHIANKKDIARPKNTKQSLTLQWQPR